ncbi:MAG: hypothetical protein FJX76_04890 [Armatimonadetes bacterium]|nr:hypothetical protein [Armatimonadota bacterium]
MRPRRARGATIHGCLVMALVLSLVTTFGIYNANKLEFHVIVASLCGLGCFVMLYRDARASAAGLALVALPAAISAALGYLGVLQGEALQLWSVLLYVAGPVIYLVLATVLAYRAGAFKEVEEEVPAT